MLGRSLSMSSYKQKLVYRRAGDCYRVGSLLLIGIEIIICIILYKYVHALTKYLFVCVRVEVFVVLSGILREKKMDSKFIYTSFITIIQITPYNYS